MLPNICSQAQAVCALRKGGVIAYPTEAVYGLGCDPRQKKAVMHLLSIKQRSADKGLILVGASWAHLKPWCQEVSPAIQQRAFETWPGPYTWLFPAAHHTPTWLTGSSHDQIAVRVSDHPVVKALCTTFQGAIVSTSANVSGTPPLKTAEQVEAFFAAHINALVMGTVGTQQRPTPIRDVISGAWIRM